VVSAAATQRLFLVSSTFVKAYVNQQLNISASALIYDNTVYRDNRVLFSNPGIAAGDFLQAAYHQLNLNYPKFYKMDNLSKLGWLASEVLLKDSFDREHYQPERVGLALANKNSSLDDDIRYLESAAEIASPSLFVYTLPNIVIGEICIRNKFKGEHAFFIQESFDAEFMEQHVRSLFERNILDVCICGWVDFLFHDYKAALFLVERADAVGQVPFSAGAMNDTFNLAALISE